ncbi:Glycogen phosphorylase [Thioalkalivibrio nitratireducens DSM 14787]|uniref:Alpha-1,4 glucan phosphorylase n=1 Tax=Thioalkalivibrio nitratireducens (strain DSM 14787 / UNIQEM 213 / ALEN2) TaxID=1255043 RepID=L0DYP1_THIND|nr:glycogen/starch/alpha-glucan phosphorylase [Thioalkalivibrio nitratireducens]AGA34168.1 Glycogen phosphorylase [Thioalkalivibrio nitratireducens DSM 14787]
MHGSSDERTRTGMSPEALKRAFVDSMFYVQARYWEVATPHDLYMAAAYTVRDRMLERWIHTAETYRKAHARTVCYLSAEYLLGPQLGNNLINLGIVDSARQGARDLGMDLQEILDQEPEPGLGNGGLGRLAACYLDSLATLSIPAIGYGIRYEHGIFDQSIVDGWQVEDCDLWLTNGNPWEIPRPLLRFPVRFGGHTEPYTDEHGRFRVRWVPELELYGMAYDTPILGFGVDNTNLLRLWHATAGRSFDLQAFQKGDYYGAVNAKVAAENITKVLYPNDEPEAGKELRLKQQYFFVSCSLQDMMRAHLQQAPNLEGFHERYAAQLNDTHPSIAVAELMRLCLDEHGMDWEAAWEITRRTFAYTNHTLLPEALETWPVELFGRLLPRHLEIIYEINARFLDELRMRYPFDPERVARMSLIEEGPVRRVRMAHLATVGSFAVNGVAAIHSELVKSTVMRDFHELWPEKFHNVTNGVTPRRFVQLSNPELCGIVTDLAGPGWVRDAENLRTLEPHADDAAFQQRWQAMKRAAKERLAARIREATGAVIDPQSLFDIQVKRIHEYKRQHLNLLHIVALYHRIKQGADSDPTPRTFVFGGKAAPGYFMAKLIIKLIHSVAEVINRDPEVNERLRVVFVPNFNVKNAECIYPAADLSEQISTAGKEASGTGNMKFSMNGALTIGTLDGANVEIRHAVGHENFFLFGLTVSEVERTLAEGYCPWEIYRGNDELREVIDLLRSGLFSHGDPDLFRPLTDSLLQHDPYLLLADYPAYIETQARAGDAFRDVAGWTRMSILNSARTGCFSSDRAIREYCGKIWRVEPMPVSLATNDARVSR